MKPQLRSIVLCMMIPTAWIASSTVLFFSANGVSVKNSVPSNIRFRMDKENYFRTRKRFSQLRRLLDDSVVTQKIGRELHPNVESIIDKITEHILDSVINPLSNKAYYLPADRTGLMHAHKSVTSTLIGSVTTAGSRPTVEVPELSGILTDFLNRRMVAPYAAFSHERPRIASRPRPVYWSEAEMSGSKAARRVAGKRWRLGGGLAAGKWPLGKRAEISGTATSTGSSATTHPASS